MTRSLEQSTTTSRAVHSTVHFTDACRHPHNREMLSIPILQSSTCRFVVPTNLHAQSRKSGRPIASESVGWSSSLAKGTTKGDEKPSAHRRPSLFSTPGMLAFPQIASRARFSSPKSRAMPQWLSLS